MLNILVLQYENKRSIKTSANGQHPYRPSAIRQQVVPSEQYEVLSGQKTLSSDDRG